MVKFWLATLVVLLRGGPVLASTVKVTVAFPLLLAGEVRWTQLSVGAATVQVEVAVTVTVAGPPGAAIGCPGELRLHVPAQVLVAAAWLTLKGWPPMRMVVMRAGPVFGFTVKVTVELPLPLTGQVIWIQLSGATTSQVPLAVMLTLPGPPLPSMVCPGEPSVQVPEQDPREPATR